MPVWDEDWAVTDKRHGNGDSFGDRSGDRRRAGGGRSQGRPGNRHAPQRHRGQGDHAAHRPAPAGRRIEDRPERRVPPGLEAKPGEPPIPPDIDTRQLDRAVRAELRSLPKELAEIVAGHLLLAGELVDTDPELAYAHAEAARRRAARLPIVREGAAETAYAAGKYDVALGEYRALRRMTGAAEYLPVMADCERALGRPQQALRLLRESVGQPMDPAAAIEAKIVEAGARHDLGQTAEAARLLRATVAGLGARQPEQMRPPLARLHYALADILLALDQTEDAHVEFIRSAGYDDDGETDAQERIDELEGMNIVFDDSDDSAGPEREEGAHDVDRSL